MRRFALITGLAAALSLSACGKTSIEAASAYTVGSADAAYISASNVGTYAVQLGKLDRVTFHDLDEKAYLALLALRAARKAGTQQDLLSLNAAFTSAIAALNAYKVN